MIFQILAECTVFCERRNALTEFPMMDRCRRSRSALERIYAKVLENLGGLDRGITPDDVHAFEATMQSLGKPVDAKIYPDAGHAFETPPTREGTNRRTLRMRNTGRARS